MSGGFFIAILMGVLVVARGAFYAVQEARRYLKSPAHQERVAARRRLRAGVDALREGERVTLTGTVRALDELVDGPLSGCECVVALATVDVVIPSANPQPDFAFLPGSRDRPTFVATIHQVVMKPFVLETPHGAIVVDGHEVVVDLPASPVIPRRRERELALLVAHDYEVNEFDGREFREVAVTPGDRVSVAGVVAVTRDASVEHGYRDAPTVARLVAHESFPLSIGKPR